MFHLKLIDGSDEDTIILPDGNYSSDTVLLKIQEILDDINDSRTKDYAVDLNINFGKIYFYLFRYIFFRFYRY